MDQLCFVCSQIDLDAALCSPAEGGAPHHSNVHELELAASTGCSLCSAIINQIEVQTLGLAAIDRSQNIYCNLWNWNEDEFFPEYGSASIIFSTRHQKDCPRGSWSVILGIYIDEELASLNVISGRSIARLFNIHDHFTLAKRWFNNCTNHHKYSCPSEKRILPSRIVDVSEPVRLRCTQNEYGEWVALSHCWGETAGFTTTRQNVLELQQKVDIEQLPATFRDAILVTRTMGFKFLWIDSLCILQDSIEDWAREAKEMHHYYKHAQLTIAVDCAAGDQEGFLDKTRSGDEYCSGIKLTTNRLKGVHSANIRYNVDHVGQNPKQSYLSDRAWTLQEDLLSPRSLHFTEEYISWECQTYRVTEADRCPPGVSDSELPSITKRYFLNPQTAVSSPVLQKWSYMRKYLEPLPRWYNILEEYNRRKLTFSKDRLIALDGIIQEMQIQTGFKSIFGLWEEDLPYGLLWQIDARGSPPESKRAPSWSWAGLDIAWHWGDNTNKLWGLYYGSGSGELLYDATDCAKISLSSAEVLSIQGKTMPLKELLYRTQGVFRAYWRPPVTHSEALQWNKAESSKTVILSFDEDTNPSEEQLEVEQQDEELCAPVLEGSDASSGSPENNPGQWNQQALESVIVMKLVCARGHNDTRFYYSLLLSPSSESDVFHRVGIAEVPASEQENVEDWTFSEVAVG